MSKKRTLYRNAYVHTMNRGSRKEILFVDDFDRIQFLKYVNNAAQKSGDRVVSFCLMPNHYHILWRVYSQKSLPKTMQRIGTAYAMYFTRKYGLVGSVFQGRYYSVTAKSIAQRLTIMRYIHRNPSELAGWTCDYTDFPWSSHGLVMKRRDFSGVIDLAPYGVTRFFPDLETFEKFVLENNKEAMQRLKEWDLG